MTEGPLNDRRAARAAVQTLPLAIAVILGIAGARLALIGDRTALTGGVLLIVAAIAAAGVALGGVSYGPDSEGRLDLSTRIGLGLLGGVLAGLLHGVMTEAAGWLGIIDWFGAGIDADLSAMEWWNRAAFGGLWGLGLGAVYPFLAGPTFLKRGATFGLIVAAWQLIYVYPFQRGLGIAGLDAGWGVVPIVVVGVVAAAVVAAWVIAWGGRQPGEPLSSPLVT